MAARALFVALLNALVAVAGAQDSVPVRRVMALDIGKMSPFHRTYDIIVYRADSATIIGRREVRLEASRYAGSPAWLLTETRSGAVAASESLYVAADARPVHWSSIVGPARLAIVFVGDSLLGATTVGGFKQNLVLPSRPDLVVSSAMLELVLGLLPLQDQWKDSAAVLTMTPTERSVRAVELTMLGAEQIQLDSATSRDANVVAVRSDSRSILYWIDSSTGAVLRMQQVLPPHTGSVLEYRFRLGAVTP